MGWEHMGEALEGSSESDPSVTCSIQSRRNPYLVPMLLENYATLDMLEIHHKQIDETLTSRFCGGNFD